jgi:hypothetical protein
MASLWVGAHVWQDQPGQALVGMAFVLVLMPPTLLHQVCLPYLLQQAIIHDEDLLHNLYAQARVTHIKTQQHHQHHHATPRT